MISAPSRGEDIQAWCARLLQELQPVMSLAGDGKHIAVGRGSIRFIPMPRNYAFAAGKAWPRSAWTGEVTRYLAVPRDGATAPFYVSKQQWDEWIAGGLPSNLEPFDLEADDIHVDAF